MGDLVGLASALNMSAGLGNLVKGGTNPKLVFEENKFRYLFGKVDSSEHNYARSLQNQKQLEKIGVFNTIEGRKTIIDHLDQVINDPSNIIRSFTKTSDGVTQNFEIRQSLFSGRDGLLRFNSTFEVMNDGTRRLTTIIPKGGGRWRKRRSETKDKQ